jgi:hypothetical protein
MNPSRHPGLARDSRRPLVVCRRGLVSGAILVLATVSCSITEPSSRAMEQVELTRNRQRWAAAGIHAYAFDYQLLCFCAPESTAPVRVMVRQDAVVAVVRRSDGLPAGTSYGWPRVDALFDDIQRRLDQHAARVTVDYDPTYGYPRSIVVDVAAMAADDEYSHMAGNLRPLP